MDDRSPESPYLPIQEGHASSSEYSDASPSSSPTGGNTSGGVGAVTSFHSNNSSRLRDRDRSASLVDKVLNALLGGPEDTGQHGSDGETMVMNPSEVLQRQQVEFSGPLSRHVTIPTDDDGAHVHERTTSVTSMNSEDMYSVLRVSRCERVLVSCGAAVAYLLLPIYIGIAIVFFSLRRRDTRRPLFVNQRDWLVLAFIGATSQLSLIPFIINFLPGVKHILVDDLNSPSDYYATFALYPTTAIFYTIVGCLHVVLDRKSYRKLGSQLIGIGAVGNSGRGGKGRGIGAMSSSSSVVRRNRLEHIYSHLLQYVEYPSEYLIPATMTLGFLLVVMCRFCQESGTDCVGDSGNQLWNSAYYQQPVFYSAVFFQWCEYNTFIAFSALTIGMFWQHLRLVQVFTYPSHYGARYSEQIASDSSSPTGPESPSPKSRLLPPKRGGKGDPQRRGSLRFRDVNWHDLSHPDGIQNYLVLYHRIIGSMNNHPVINAFCTPSFALSVVMFVGCTATVVSKNLYDQEQLAGFTLIFLSMLVLSALIIGFFIGLTVQLEKIIALQSSIIAKVQNDVQQQIDALRGKGVSGGLGMLEAKVNALKALDVYVRHADCTPKLIGLSLNIIRWSTIILLLMFINGFFIALYLIYCTGEDVASRSRSITIFPSLTLSNDSSLS